LKLMPNFRSWARRLHAVLARACGEDLCDYTINL